MNKMENQVDVLSMGRGKIPRMVMSERNLTIRKDAAANGRYSTNVYVIQDRIAKG